MTAVYISKGKAAVQRRCCDCTARVRMLRGSSHRSLVYEHQGIDGTIFIDQHGQQELSHHLRLRSVPAMLVEAIYEAHHVHVVHDD